MGVFAVFEGAILVFPPNLEGLCFLFAENRRGCSYFFGGGSGVKNKPTVAMAGNCVGKPLKNCGHTARIASGCFLTGHAPEAESTSRHAHFAGLGYTLPET